VIVIFANLAADVVAALLDRRILEERA
jgi:ABC-type dipeptide/oligopeptide/nickel transport system permease component